jgi:flagellar biosynthesis/type III secretory pathway chaperone
MAPTPAGGSDRRPEQAPALLAALERILDDERAALRVRNTDALLAAVNAKRRILADIARVLPDALRADGTALLESLRRCRAMNDAAGAVIAALRHDTTQALGLLGIDSGPQAYGEVRRGPGSAAGRELARG